jgi:hypothetical protein
MTTEQIIRQYTHAPVGQSIEPIALSLATHSVFLATDEPGTQQAIANLNRFRFRTDKDNAGRTWAYAYTNRAEFSRAFPRGGGYVEMPFKDFFHMIERDQQFAGIFLNAGSEAAYPIPRELFTKVSNLLPDRRAMREIRVTWQLGLFIVAIFLLPGALVPFLTARTEHRPMTRLELQITIGIAGAMLALMAIAVASRVRQAKKELLPDGQPVSAWVLRQMLLGIPLCIAGTGVFALLIWIGAPKKIAAICCAVVACPGVMLIGRALAPRM